MLRMGLSFLSSISTYSPLTAHRHSAKSAEPPPPYPPPQPFVPLSTESIKSQVGLLRGYFEHRFASAGLDTLPDDSPNPVQAKLGPLGQVLRPSSAAIAAAAGSKKKAKPKDAAAAAAISVPGAVGAAMATAVTAGIPVAGVAAVGVVTGVVVGGVVQQPPSTPALSSVGLLSPIAGSMVMSTAATPSGEAQSQGGQTPKKKKAAPGPGPGAGASAGGTGAGTGGNSGGGGGGSGGGGGTNKKRGRPPEGLPPVVVASA